MEEKNYGIVDSVETLSETIKRVRRAQKIFAAYTIMRRNIFSMHTGMPEPAAS